MMYDGNEPTFMATEMVPATFFGRRTAGCRGLFQREGRSPDLSAAGRGRRENADRPIGSARRSGNARREATIKFHFLEQRKVLSPMVELEFPPIAFDPVRFSRRSNFPGPPELGAVNPDFHSQSVLR